MIAIGILKAGGPEALEFDVAFSREVRCLDIDAELVSEVRCS
jgi:hypothetical protein